jgi:hypothetical protein
MAERGATIAMALPRTSAISAAIMRPACAEFSAPGMSAEWQRLDPLSPAPHGAGTERAIPARLTNGVKYEKREHILRQSQGIGRAAGL